MSSPSRITILTTLALALGGGLAVAAAGCGGSSGGAPAEPPGPAAGNYERTTPLSFQRYRWTQVGGGSWTETWQVVQGSATGFTRRIYQGNSTWYWQVEYQIGAGGSVGLASWSSAGFGGQNLTLDYTASPPTLQLPADQTPGAVTTLTSTSTYSSFTRDQTRVMTVNGVEAVTVPAGTFQALKVSTLVTYQDDPTRYTGVVWWAPGVGRVRAEYTDDSPAPYTSTMELLEQGKGAFPIVTPDGGYQVTALTCGSQPAPSPLADLITGGNVLGLLVEGATGATHWSDDGCTIQQPLALAYPAIGLVTATPAGPFACTPSAAACAALSVATFGEEVCGRADASGAKQYAFSHTGVPIGEPLTLRRLGGTECSEVGAAEPLRYTLTRTE